MTNEQFLETIFGPASGRAWVTALGEKEASGSWFGGRAVSHLSCCLADTANYWCVGLLRDTAKARSLGEVEAVHAIVIDDVGTKITGDQQAFLQQAFGSPAFVVRTSPGNHQLVYIPKDGPIRNLAMFAEFMAVLSDRGLTDKACIDPTRYFRLPTGRNWKPAHNGYAVNLLRSNPDNRLDFEAAYELLTGRMVPAGASLQDTPLPSGAGRKNSADLNSPDPWLRALQELGLVIGDGSKPGVVDIKCPFEAGHSDGRETGTSYLGDASFKCHHSHCVNRPQHEWRAEIERQLEAHVCILGETGRGWIAAASFGDADLAEVQALAASLRRRADERWVDNGATAGRLPPGTWDQLLEQYVYIKDVARFVLVSEPRVLLDDKAFAVDARRVVEVGLTGVKSAAAIFLNESGGRGRVLDRLAYAPGERRFLVMDDGSTALNQWVAPTLAPALGVDDADVAPWLEVLDHVYPDRAARDTALDFMAFVLQRPGVKINWMYLTLGGQGIGKDSCWAPLVRVLGEDNAKMVQTSDLRSPFNARWALCQLAVFGELSTTGLRDKEDGYNDLKPYIAAPPDFLTVRAKYQRDYDVRNVMVTVGFTNKDDAVALEADDRRFYVYGSDAAKIDATAFWAWLEGGDGLAKCYGYLLARQISAAFDPHVCPAAVGRAKQHMTESSMTAAGRWVVQTFKGRSMVTVDEILAEAQQTGVPGAVSRSITDKHVAEGLRALRGRRWRDGQQVRVDGRQTRVWTLERHELLEQLDGDKLRDALEAERKNWNNPNDAARALFKSEKV